MKMKRSSLALVVVLLFSLCMVSSCMDKSECNLNKSVDADNVANQYDLELELRLSDKDERKGDDEKRTL